NGRGERLDPVQSRVHHAGERTIRLVADPSDAKVPHSDRLGQRSWRRARIRCRADWSQAKAGDAKGLSLRPAGVPRSPTDGRFSLVSAIGNQARAGPERAGPAPEARSRGGAD